MATETSSGNTPLGTIGAVWGIVGITALLGNAIVKLTPLALAPFERGELSWWQWVLYGLCIVFMAYSEGYKGFQKAFAPRVAARAAHLHKNPTLLHVLLAPAFCMALFHATRKRLIVSWVLIVMVVLLVLSVSLLPYPYRQIVDAGVVVGLTWGLLSVWGFALRWWLRGPLDVSPEVP